MLFTPGSSLSFFLTSESVLTPGPCKNPGPRHSGLSFLHEGFKDPRLFFAHPLLHIQLSCPNHGSRSFSSLFGTIPSDVSLFPALEAQPGSLCPVNFHRLPTTSKGSCFYLRFGNRPLRSFFLRGPKLSDYPFSFLPMAPQLVKRDGLPFPAQIGDREGFDGVDSVYESGVQCLLQERDQITVVVDRILCPLGELVELQKEFFSRFSPLPERVQPMLGGLLFIVISKSGVEGRHEFLPCSPVIAMQCTVGVCICPGSGQSTLHVRQGEDDFLLVSPKAICHEA